VTWRVFCEEILAYLRTERTDIKRRVRGFYVRGIC